MFKTRHLKDTSKRNMLRIDKRERVLASVLCFGMINKESSMTLFMYNKEMLDWINDLIQETRWFSAFVLTDPPEERSFGTIVSESSTRLRIYRKWIYHSEKKSFKQILKYLHTPLYPAFLVLNGLMSNDEDGIAISMLYTRDSSEYLLCDWFKDLFDIICHCYDSGHVNIISFDRENADKLLLIAEPIIKQLPEMYQKIYKEAI